MSEKAVGLWSFEIIAKNNRTEVRRTGVWKAHLVGPEEMARAEAATIATQLNCDAAADEEIFVKPVLLEAVGPRTCAHIEKAILTNNSSAAMARFLAGLLAPYVARDRLDINPDLAQIAEELLVEAAQHLSRAQHRTAQREAGLVGPDGRPVTQGRA